MDEQGLLTIYSIDNIAPKGLKPSMKLVEICQAYYSERNVGVQRVYSALSANHRIDALLRCYNTELELGWVVVPEDGKQYQIDVMQKVIGKDAVDITLVRLEKDYEIYTEPTE